ncbi:hypothetical protein B0O99DRAFT_281154 [Bisporella sp. PMI_857]|nr:hypothetical protein B0O99DRAFT_281154 [Bisporella sp. PMI_857]
MMSLASFAALGAGEENPDPRGNHMELIRMYRHSCSQALVLSNYTRPGQYTIEAMLLYMQVEFVLTSVDPVNSYVFIGAVVRIALRMGLHRDASKIGSDLSVFQAEMRRRHWHILQQLDLIISFHIGLPPMIQSVESDTEYPRNLRDEDLDKDLAELPAARPETERTPMSYIVGKSRICVVFGKIAALAHRISLPPYDEVLYVDKLLEEAHSKIPPFLKFVPIELAIIDPPELVIQRFNIALLYHKCRCVLHRKYLLIEKYSEEFAYSRFSGYDASMRLLRLQTEMYRLCQPGGLLCKDKWIVSALTTRDSLLAATMVYLNLMQLIDISPLDAATDTEQKRIDMIQVLESSFFTWKRLQGLLPDARKASDILGLMLQKIKGALASQKSSKGDTSQQAATRFSDGSGNEWVEYNAQNDMSHTVIPIPDSGSQDVPSMVAPMVPMESLDTMFDMPTNFDWDLFDDHLRPQPMATAQLQEWPDISIEYFHQFENSGMMYNL